MLPADQQEVLLDGARQLTGAQHEELLRTGQLGLSEAALVKASLIVYGLPLVAMVGAGLFAALAGLAEIWIALFSIWICAPMARILNGFTTMPVKSSA